jgi:signal transduction histidine kinase
MFIELHRGVARRGTVATAAAIGGLSAGVVLIAGLAVALIDGDGSASVTSLVLLGAVGTAFAAGHLVARIQRNDGPTPLIPAPVATEDAASIAHDVRAPLTTVTSYLDLLVSNGFGPLPPAARDAAQRAAIASERVREIVDAALGAASGPTQPGDEIDLSEVASAALESLAIRLASTGANVTVDELPRVPAFTPGDRTRWLRILQNLADNALKFHRPGEPPRIVISATVLDGAVELTVRDHGAGIPVEARDRVFSRGVRGTRDAEEAPGHGVGLATVRRLAAELGGSVEIDPRTTNGTAVRVVTPLH